MADERAVLMQFTEKDILVPLTTSLYVPGRLMAAAGEKVLVDVGTGFYVEKVCFSVPSPSCLGASCLGASVWECVLMGFTGCEGCCCVL